MPRDTGFPRADAEADFLRARRQQVVSGLASSLHLRHQDTTALSFQEVVEALGYVSEEARGNQVIDIDAIVGSVDRVRDFDPYFRPRSGRSRQRWERIAEAARRGDPLPPIDVYQVGEQYFVRDGHHRVSVFRALGLRTVEADVRLIRTVVTPPPITGRADLRSSELRRVMVERIPLDSARQDTIWMSDPAGYHRIAEMFEAWAARTMFAERVLLEARTAARRWFEEEYEPASGLIEEGGLMERGETQADAYLRVACERYATFLEHDWNPEVVQALRES